MTEIQLASGTLVLVSYETPVAAFLYSSNEWLRTEKKWSKTTTQHLNKWLALTRGPGADYKGTKPQEFFDNLLEKAPSA